MMTDVGDKPMKEKYSLGLPYPICQVTRDFKVTKIGFDFVTKANFL